MASPPQFVFNTAQYFRPKPPSLKIREEICRGAYGSVHFGELDGRPVAVKRIHRLLLEAARGQGGFEQVMTDFKQECQLLETLDHPHVVDFRGAFYDETTDEPLLVMERMRENLREFLERMRDDLSSQRQLEVCLAIARGLRFLHTHIPPIVHRDLTDKNVMFGRDGQVKIGDLGQSRLKANNAEYFNTAQPGAIPFMPPEAMREQSHYNEKLDIFSFGVLMLEVAIQHPPRVRLLGIGAVKEIVRRREELSKLEDDHPLKPLILSCLEDDPKERPDIVTVHTQLLSMVEGVEVHERSYFESSLSSSGHFATTVQQLRQQLSIMEEECRRKDEVMSKKEEELKQKDITIRAQQIEIQRLTNQPAMSEMLLHEADLEELCYIPFGIKAFSVTPEGGTFPLGSEDASLEFPPGAVTKETYVRYGIILHGPFELPAGHRMASVVVYLNLGSVTLVKPIYLSLADWCEKKAHMDSEELMFIRAPHVLKEGKERKYQFSVHAIRNTEVVSVDKLQIGESKCLYAKVLQEGRGVQEWFCATPLHQMDDKCLRVRILFTWVSDTWIKVLEEVYMKQKKWQKHPEVPPLCAQFRINTPVEAIMSDTRGPGWTAILDGVDTIEKEAILSLTTLFQPTRVKSSIEEEIYPPSIRCCVLYDEDKKLTGKALWAISFPSIRTKFTYKILTDDSKPPPANVYSAASSERQILSSFESHVSSGYISGATGLSSQLGHFGDGSLPSTSSHGSRSHTMPSPPATSTITSGDLLCQKPTMKDLNVVVIPRVASEWRNFGLQLDIESHILNVVMTPNGSSVDHCFTMLEHWLNGKQGTGMKPKTWASVLEAVADSCGSEVRRDITEELNVKCQNPRPV